jgi:hypothetical protein
LKEKKRDSIQGQRGIMEKGQRKRIETKGGGGPREEAEVRGTEGEKESAGPGPGQFRVRTRNSENTHNRGLGDNMTDPS